jgi:hypothetical protein
LIVHQPLPSIQLSTITIAVFLSSTLCLEWIKVILYGYISK